MTNKRPCPVCRMPIWRRSDQAVYCSGYCKKKAAEGRRKERGAPLPPPRPPLPPSHCVPCRKVACPTEDAARFAKRAAEDRTGRVAEVRYYECPEGWWHWTRMDATLDGFRARSGNGAR